MLMFNKNLSNYYHCICSAHGPLLATAGRDTGSLVAQTGHLPRVHSVRDRRLRHQIPHRPTAAVSPDARDVARRECAGRDGPGAPADGRPQAHQPARPRGRRAAQGEEGIVEHVSRTKRQRCVCVIQMY